MRWYRNLIAQKWDYSDRATRRGRPPLTQETVDMVLDLLEENPTWGDDSISNRCANVGIEVSPSSVRAIRHRYGIPPAPERQKTGDWARFIQATWPGLAAMDFTTVETLDPETNELTTLYVLFAMRVATREVHLVGITEHPNKAWMLQQARKLTDDFDGFFRDVTHCTIDNDRIFSKAFTAVLKDRGVKCVRTCVRTPNMNAHVERFMLTFTSEAMRWVVPRGEWHLRGVVREFLAYFHEERNHQGLGSAIIQPGPGVGRGEGEIRCRTRLGGALRYYPSGGGATFMRPTGLIGGRHEEAPVSIALTGA